MSSPPVSPSERALYEELKQHPEFECLPIPASWFKKFNIPPRNPLNPREYIESNYAMKMAFAPKDLPPLIIDEPQQNGKLVEVPAVEDVPMEIVSRPFEVPEGKPFPAVLPSLTDAAFPQVAGKTCPDTELPASQTASSLEHDPDETLRVQVQKL